VRVSYARLLGPAAAALLLQGGFAVAVMALDRRVRGISPNVQYVIAVELAMAAAFLGILAFKAARRRREIGAAMAAPLDSATPPARGAAEEPWRELALETKAAAARAIAEREASAREELDAFLASVHALKTPATALSLMAQRAESAGEGIPAADARLEIDELDLLLDRTLARIRLVDFDRGSRVRRFDAAEIARSVVRRHRRLFIARGIAVEVTGGFEAESDPEWVAFILAELVSNAAKHARTRVAIELAASAEGAFGGGLRARIDVSDDGPGFSPEEAARAFGRSASGAALGGDAPTGAMPSPSGYGLYLAAEAAKRLGASLEIVGGEGAHLRISFAVAPPLFG
jgi:signal transduction histidine kinase